MLPKNALKRHMMKHEAQDFAEEEKVLLIKEELEPEDSSPAQQEEELADLHFVQVRHSLTGGAEPEQLHHFHSWIRSLIIMNQLQKQNDRDWSRNRSFFPRSRSRIMMIFRNTVYCARD
jgi:hypothetical protein